MDPDEPGVRGVQGKDVRFCTSKYSNTDSTKGSFVGLMVYDDSLPYNSWGGALYLYKIGGITRQIGIPNAGKVGIAMAIYR